MCGLAGIIGEKRNREILLNSMLSIQNHLGPDFKSRLFSSKLEKFSNYDFIDKKVMNQLCKEYQLGDISNSFFLSQCINLSEFIN